MGVAQSRQNAAHKAKRTRKATRKYKPFAVAGVPLLHRVTVQNFLLFLVCVAIVHSFTPSRRNTQNKKTSDI